MNAWFASLLHRLTGYAATALQKLFERETSSQGNRKSTAPKRSVPHRIARIHPILGNTRGLFLPQTPTTEIKPAKGGDEVYGHSGWSYNFESPVPLNPTDFLIFCAVAILVERELAKTERWLNKQTKKKQAKRKHHKDPTACALLYANFRLSDVLRLIHRTTRDTNSVRASLGRLQNANLKVTVDGKSYSRGLLTCSFQDASGKGIIHCRPHPVFYPNFGGSCKRQYAQYHIDDLVALTRARRLTYLQLATWISPGCTRKLTIETHAENLYGGLKGMPAAELKRSLSKARKALLGLQDIGWKVEQIKKGTFEITRPKYD